MRLGLPGLMGLEIRGEGAIYEAGVDPWEASDPHSSTLRLGFSRRQLRLPSDYCFRRPKVKVNKISKTGPFQVDTTLTRSH